MTEIKKRRLAEKAQKSVGVSQCVLAHKFHISASYVNKILRKSGIYCFKREKVPLVSETQLVNQRLRVGRLYREVLSIGDGNPHFVMDDESYFTLRGSDMPQNDHYYATCKYAAEAENHEQLKQRILYCLHRINETRLYNMMKHMKSKLRQVRDNGVNYLLH